MTTRILWYISPVDGRLPWHDEGRYDIDHKRLIRLAQTIESGGFYGALLGTYAQDVLINASSLFSHTESLNFLIPIYPGLTSPRLLAQQILTFDQFSGGRIKLNLVNGQDELLQSYGLPLDKAERYKFSSEYWDLFVQFYEGHNADYTGTFLDPDRLHSALAEPDAEHAPGDSDATSESLHRKPFGDTDNPTHLPLAPTQRPHVPLWGAGASPSGIEFAGRTVETYLTWFRETQSVAQHVKDAEDAAASNGRSFTGVGTHGSLTVRNSRTEAEEAFYTKIEASGADRIAERLNLAISAGSQGRTDLTTFTAPDAKRQGWIDSVRAGRLPTLEDLRLEGRIFAGETPWSSLDIFGIGGGTYIVGSGQDAAGEIARIKQEVPPTDTFIFSGWPLTQEAQYAAEYLLPHIEDLSS